MYDLLITHQSNEGSKPDWDGSRLQKSTIRNDNAVDGELPVLLYVNPRRGSTSGGEEIYLIVKNPPSTTVLYARFGCNIAPTVSSLIDSEPKKTQRMYSQLTSSLTLRMEYWLVISLQELIPESSTLHYVKRLLFMRKVMGSLWFPSNTIPTPLKRQLFFSMLFPTG